MNKFEVPLRERINSKWFYIKSMTMRELVEFIINETIDEVEYKLIEEYKFDLIDSDVIKVIRKIKTSDNSGYAKDLMKMVKGGSDE